VIALYKIALSLPPVFVFLAVLVFLDSYKLVSLRSIIRAIIIGSIVAVVAMFFNSWLLSHIFKDVTTFSRYLAPFIEECLKALFLIYLIGSKRVGFMVDAAIYGFAVGAGFAFVENVYYLHAVESSNLLLWVVRGFGTAAMHCGTMAIFGIISKSMADRHNSVNAFVYLPGFAIAVIIHSLFNHFLLPPVMATVVLLIFFPVVLVITFEQSEKAARHWLGIGMDTDVEMLEVITTGKVSGTRVGQYLESLKTRFPGEVVADMLCLLRLHLELALRAKGMLMMREIGFKIDTDIEIEEKFRELKYLEKSIGKTGKLAILPFIHTSSRDIWQIYMLKK